MTRWARRMPRGPFPRRLFLLGRVVWAVRRTMGLAMPLG